MNYDDRPFCACSTPSGVGGIAVIRASGENSAELLDSCTRILRTFDSKTSKISELGGYVAAYAVFINPINEEIIDNVVITRFKSPHSYTGDDMVEISCHGGDAVKQEILSIMLDNGFRAALPGEFTRKAFINGKLDLSSAEAVMDVIASDSKRALKAANMQLNGKLNKELIKVEDELYHALSIIEMIVEFPEHDDTPDNENEVLNLINNSVGQLNKLKKSYGQGRILSERMRIALLGSPNSGKSSLLNCLSGYDRAIVTDVAGTTRDILEVMINIDDIPVTLVDTAGIRQTDDKIEAIGVERAGEEIKVADLLLYMVSPDETMDNFVEQLKNISFETQDNVIILFSKNDEGSNSNEEEMKEIAQEYNFSDFLSISVLNMSNIDDLKQKIVDFYEKQGNFVSGSVILTNRRHYEKISEAIESLMMAVEAINNGLGVDIASSVIRNALELIGQITGKTVSEHLANDIFGRFCIGK